MSGKPNPGPARVTISILNWNGADKTLRCLQAVDGVVKHSGAQVACTVEVLDNGSAPADWQQLQTGIAQVQERGVRLSREAHNLGFAGGHNRVIARALAEGADFIWVLNNDALPEPNCLSAMLALMGDDPRCGAASPLIYTDHDRGKLDFCGAIHRWRDFEAPRADHPDEGRAMEARSPGDCWLVGTAVLLRARALQAAGVFETTYFAYFEDNELAVRLARHGYSSRLAFDARVYHHTPWEMEAQRAPYFFYLMARNEMRFWVDNTPGGWRKPVRYRVIQRAISRAYRLRQRGLKEKAAACLLGAWDGLLNRGGPPRLDRAVPGLMEFVYARAIARGVPS